MSQEERRLSSKVLRGLLVAAKELGYDRTTMEELNKATTQEEACFVMRRARARRDRQERAQSMLDTEGKREKIVIDY